MIPMRTLAFVLVCVVSAAAQKPAPAAAGQESPAVNQAAQADAGQQPPKEVDDALRARVTQFYQASVDRKYRLAMEVVAEDSRDYFFEMDKPHYYGFEIAGIKYSDQFKRAVVTVLCDTEMNMLPQGKVRVKAPLKSQWKLDNGEWFWFASRNAGRSTPFGMFSPPASGSSTPAPALPSGLPPIGKIPAVANSRAISADKTEIVLDPSQPSSDAITLSNGLDGPVGIELYVLETPGLSARAERNSIPAKGSTRVVFDYRPSSDRKIGKVLINVLPMGPVIPVKIAFRNAGAKTGAASEAGNSKGAAAGKPAASKR